MKGKMFLFLLLPLIAAIISAAAPSVETGCSLDVWGGNLYVKSGERVERYPVSTHQVVVIRPKKSDVALKGTVDISVHRIGQAWELGDFYKIPESKLNKIRGVVRMETLPSIEP